MAKRTHEFRDPVHNFIRADTAERQVIDSAAFQRLRHIHQLAMTYLVYHGATHRRFEHSLGVMDVAGRIYDVVTDPEHVHPEVRDFIFPKGSPEHLYWRRALTMAALCHDIGHLPFSHAAEKELLPAEWDHERIGAELILSEQMREIWHDVTPPLRAEDIVKLAVGPRKLPDVQFSDWEAILAEIITGDAFGADRMDYLLRDSYHLGVAYGTYDHHRLIGTLRILPRGVEDSTEPALGVEIGGLESAEGLVLARYFMYKQVYFHNIRRIYDIHLKDFLKAWLPDGHFATHVDTHLAMTDNEVMSEIFRAAKEPAHAGHEPASHLVERKHFKMLYERNPADQALSTKAARIIYEGVRGAFGEPFVRFDPYDKPEKPPDFPVVYHDGRIVSSLTASPTLSRMPVVAIDYVFVRRDLFADAERWLEKNREALIKAGEEEEA